MHIFDIVMVALIYIGTMMAYKEALNIDMNKADSVDLIMMMLWPLMSIFVVIMYVYDCAVKLFSQCKLNMFTKKNKKH